MPNIPQNIHEALQNFIIEINILMKIYKKY